MLGVNPKILKVSMQKSFRQPFWTAAAVLWPFLHSIKTGGYAGGEFGKAAMIVEAFCWMRLKRFSAGG